MRIFGIVLALLGAIVLGHEGFSQLIGEKGATPAAPAANQKRGPTPPVFGGIALVTGLLVLASSDRRD